MKKLLILLALTITISSCSNAVEEIDSREPMPDAGEKLLEGQPELSEWEIHDSTKLATTFHTTVENPPSGVELSAYLVLPATAKKSDDTFPIVMMIPGGTDWGTNAFSEDSDTKEILLENSIGFAYFDPDGRGESAGEEDANGHTHQDGLFAVTQRLIEHEKVNIEEMGLLSYSYGTTLASGMLARYADEVPYKWYVDWEGPSKREYTTSGCTPNEKNRNTALMVDCSDEEFWSERESASFLANIKIPYLRLQNIKDHVQESNEHAIDAINAATTGLSPWTRINNEDPNQSYTYANQPEYLVSKSYNTLDYVLEMFELF